MCAACLDSLKPADELLACARCGQRLPRRRVDSVAGCSQCSASPPPYDSAVSFGLYANDLRRLIHLLKYERMLPLAGPLAAKSLPSILRFGAIDLVVPVPLYWRRRWQRGFNQAALLGRHLAKGRGVPCRHNALRRVRATQVQAGLSDRERMDNVRSAFVPANAGGILGKRVLLVDDVMTTGATLAAAAAALRSAGASYIAAFTVARADREDRARDTDKAR